jgi:hypothetical protein
MLDKPENPVVTETPEEVLQIRLQHPAYHATGNDLIEGRQGMIGGLPPNEQGKKSCS